MPRSKSSSKTKRSVSSASASNTNSTGAKVDTRSKHKVVKPLAPPVKPTVGAQANAATRVSTAGKPTGESAATFRDRPLPDVPFRAVPQDDETDVLEESEDASNVHLNMVSIEMPRTQKEIQAASVLQQWSRRRLQSRAQSRVDNAELGRIYSSCSSLASRLPTVDDRLSHVRHVAIIRGPLPHVLLVLEKLLAFVRVAKDETQRRIRNALHQELDKVLASMAQLT